MGAFKIEILGVGGHGCDRKAKAGDKLYGRCGRFTCPDCLAYEFTQRLRQTGMLRDGDTASGGELNEGDVPPEGAEIYWVNEDNVVVHDLSSVAPGTPLRRYWKIAHRAEFTHWPHTPSSIVDDMLKNTRTSGSF